MATLSSPTQQALITNIRNLLNQPESTNSFWSDSELIEYINEAVRIYFVEVAHANEGQFTTTSDLNIVSGTETIALPSDFFEAKALYKKVTDGYVVLPYMNNMTESYSTTGGSSSNHYFPSYYFRGNNLVLRDVPGLSETAGLRLEYIQFPETMVTGGDSLTSQVSPVFKQLIEMYAVYKAKLKESLVSGVNVQGPAVDNLKDLYGAFKESITNRSKNPTFITPFNP